MICLLRPVSQATLYIICFPCIVVVTYVNVDIHSTCLTMTLSCLKSPLLCILYTILSHLTTNLFYLCYFVYSLCVMMFVCHTLIKIIYLLYLLGDKLLPRRQGHWTCLQYNSASPVIGKKDPLKILYLHCDPDLHQSLTSCYQSQVPLLWKIPSKFVHNCLSYLLTNIRKNVATFGGGINWTKESNSMYNVCVVYAGCSSMVLSYWLCEC